MLKFWCHFSLAAGELLIGSHVRLLLRVGCLPPEVFGHLLMDVSYWLLIGSGLSGTGHCGLASNYTVVVASYLCLFPDFCCWIMLLSIYIVTRERFKTPYHTSVAMNWRNKSTHWHNLTKKCIKLVFERLVGRSTNGSNKHCTTMKYGWKLVLVAATVIAPQAYQSNSRQLIKRRRKRGLERKTNFPHGYLHHRNNYAVSPHA